jgi:steroid delta-isomerase-like uncharacterized protein
MSAESAVVIVEELVAAWNARDLDAVVGLLAEDVEWHDRAMPEPPARGRQAVREFAENVLHAFPDFEYEIQPPLCPAGDGTRCAIVWRISATYSRPLQPLGLAPTGRRARFAGVDVLDIQGGKVTRILTTFDPAAAAEQLLDLSLRPRPGTFWAWCVVAVQRLLAARARWRVNRGARRALREEV